MKRVTRSLLYWREATVFAAPFDLDRLEMTELPAPVLQRVAGNLEGGAHYDLAEDGTLVYVVGDRTATAEVDRTLMWLDGSGDMTPMTEVVKALA